MATWTIVNQTNVVWTAVTSAQWAKIGHRNILNIVSWMSNCMILVTLMQTITNFNITLNRTFLEIFY